MSFGHSPFAPGNATHTVTLDEESEWEVIARARLNRREFEPIYMQYAEPIYRYCVHRLGEREAAEDAMSRVFAKAIAKLPAARTGTVRSWLFAIAHNLVTDALRTRRWHLPLEVASTMADHHFDPEDAALHAEADDEVLSLLAHLSDEQRRIVTLRLSGLTAPEIASVLEMGVSAVKMAQLRAYAKLRDLLSERPREEADHD